MERGITLDGPATCVIRARGTLSADWSTQMAGLRVVIDRRDGHPVTELAGRLIDQAALHGVLAALYELGMPLLSVACVPSAAEGGGDLP